MHKPTSKVALWFVPVLIHAFAGTITIAYNMISREFFHTTGSNDTQIKIAAIGYFLAASSLSGYLNRRLVLKAITTEHMLLIPLWRALTNSITWLGAIPVMAGVAIAINGRVHPVNFPNFCASIVIGWLIATSYSTLFYTGEISKLSDLTWSRAIAKLQYLVASLPYLAIGVPLIAATSMLLLIHPDDIATKIGGTFNAFLVMLYTLGAYGASFAVGRTRKTRMLLASVPVLSPHPGHATPELRATLTASRQSPNPAHRSLPRVPEPP